MPVNYILKRLGYGLLLMLGVVVLNFLLIRLAPGDPVVIAGEMGGATEEMLGKHPRGIRPEQTAFDAELWIYVSSVAQGDLGESFFFNQPVSKLIALRIGPTILLVIVAQILSIVIGVFLDVYIRAPTQLGWYVRLCFGLCHHWICRSRVLEWLIMLGLRAVCIKPSRFLLKLRGCNP